jgi:hypothetical protein
LGNKGVINREKQMKVLSLQEVTGENWRATLDLTVFPEQQSIMDPFVKTLAQR